MTTTSTSLGTSSTTTRDAGVHHSLVRPFLLADAATTFANGLAYVVGAAWLTEWLGAPVDLQRGLGMFLLAFGVGVALLAFRRPVPRRGVVALVVLNEAWVVASVAYAVMGDLTALGRTWVVIQAVVVAGFAAGQLWFARRG